MIIPKTKPVKHVFCEATEKTGTEENPYPCVSSRFVADDLILSVVLSVVKVFVGFIHHVLKACA